MMSESAWGRGRRNMFLIQSWRGKTSDELDSHLRLTCRPGDASPVRCVQKPSPPTPDTSSGRGMRSSPGSGSNHERITFRVIGRSLALIDIHGVSNRPQHWHDPQLEIILHHLKQGTLPRTGCLGNFQAGSNRWCLWLFTIRGQGEVLFASRTKQTVRTWIKRNLDREKRQPPLCLSNFLDIDTEFLIWYLHQKSPRFQDISVT